MQGLFRFFKIGFYTKLRLLTFLPLVLFFSLGAIHFFKNYSPTLLLLDTLSFNFSGLLLIFFSSLLLFISFCKATYLYQKNIADRNIALENEKKVIMKMNKKLLNLAKIDDLTKLSNRVYFERVMKNILHNSSCRNNKFALLIVDLDNFKKINDSYGHQVGDALLKVIANRLKDVFLSGGLMKRVGEEILIARLGGDEFAVIIQNLKNSEDSGAIANQIIHIISKPISLSGNTIHMTASVGVACYPRAGSNFNSLYQNADRAMYYAKNNGKNNFQYFIDSLNSNEGCHTLRA
jgi:diguanylate cyclase (GGDEF)-like protein